MEYFRPEAYFRRAKHQQLDYVTEQMRGIVDDYIEVGLITSMTDTDEVLELLWNPIGSAE